MTLRIEEPLKKNQKQGKFRCRINIEPFCLYEMPAERAAVPAELARVVPPGGLPID